MKIAIVGLGYVGLPLAVEFGKIYETIGYDVNSKRIIDLNANKDATLEVTSDEIEASTYLRFTLELAKLKGCNVYIVTVPTPIDNNKQPDLNPLVNASRDIGSILKEGDIVIYESTVYPGATEEICVPVLEAESGLKFNDNFFVGYSPERINPGDKDRRITNIKKVTSGSTSACAGLVDDLYNSILHEGTHKASSIRVAEASKVIENTQRDLNIALINELAIIFNKLEIDTLEVLEAAGSKWNFLPFRPGLVGGHCIGVDPYYLTHKAQSMGYFPDVILAGRRINDGMGEYIASKVIDLMLRNKTVIPDSRILILGFTFKENCPDVRNTRVVDMVSIFDSYGINVDVHDPWASEEEAQKEYDIELTTDLKEGVYDAAVIAVAHDFYSEMGVKQIRKLTKNNGILVDIKNIFDKDDVDFRL